MRKIIYLVIAALLVIVVLIVLKNNKKNNITYDTYEVKIDTVRNTEKLSGTMLPKSEITIKSRLSGILDNYFIEVGQVLKIGDPIARIKIIPDPKNIEQAERQVQLAQLDLELEEKIYEREKTLYTKKVSTIVELEDAENRYLMKQQEFKSAAKFLEIAKNGFSQNNASISDIITATSNGTVIEMSLNEGASVIERNNFNEGTTLAIIANLDQYLFQSSVNEMLIPKLKLGKQIQVNVNALNDRSYTAKLSKINPKGTKSDGVVRFQIEASLQSNNDLSALKPGFTAVADLEVEVDSQSLVVFEKDLIYEKDSVYIHVLNVENELSKIFVKPGISDGINTSILDGLVVGQKVVIQ